VLGGISPLGHRSRLPVVIDASAPTFETVFCSAGRRGLEVEVAPGELVRLTSAVVAPIAA
jgi:Cys-tRNA(Pro)/Cys-tRNA(Cys) deacylase